MTSLKFSLIMLLTACASSASASADPTPEEIEACFFTRFPALVSQPHTPSYCFDLPSDKNGLMDDPNDPLVCEGEILPTTFEDTLYTPTAAELKAHTLLKYGDGNGDYIATTNVMDYAEQYLWPLTRDHLGSYGRAPCGGEAFCLSNDTDESICYISVTDCQLLKKPYSGTTLRTYRLTCDGDRACSQEGLSPNDCCHLTE